MHEADITQLMKNKGYNDVQVVGFPTALKQFRVFDVSTDQGSFVVRAESQMRVDPQYLSVVSLERDAAMYDLARRGGLPAPAVHDLGVHEGEKYLVVEKLPGVNWGVFVNRSDHSLQKYLASLESLGGNIAAAQRITFPVYGNVYGENLVLPGFDTFADRLTDIMQRKLVNAQRVLPAGEYTTIERYFLDKIQQVRAALEQEKSSQQQHPVLVLTNLHPMNFLVDEVTGKATGFYDLQFSQAGVKALEMYNLGLQLFSYFDQPTFELARRSFLNSYKAAGGQYDPEDPTNMQLEALLCAGHTLSGVTAYHGANDGLRNTWSVRFKGILHNVMDTGTMDHTAFADILREKTQQPTRPTIP